MTAAEAIARLESMGNPKIRDVNIKHGAPHSHFGVNLSHIRALAKEIKRDHVLARELWASGNVDARLLALLVNDAKAWTLEEFDRMVREADYFKVADWLSGYVVDASKHRDALRVVWKDDPAALVGRAGWSLTTSAVVKGRETVVKPLLDQIEREMKDAPMRKQESMNHCLVEIAFRHPELRERAIEIAERLGVFRDYPVPKGCVSPFAPIWINYLVTHA